MCDPILVILLKMRPPSGTSPLASYKEVPPPPPERYKETFKKFLDGDKKEKTLFKRYPSGV